MKMSFSAVASFDGFDSMADIEGYLERKGPVAVEVFLPFSDTHHQATVIIRKKENHGHP